LQDERAGRCAGTENSARTLAETGGATRFPDTPEKFVTPIIGDLMCFWLPAFAPK
jgi:hypothetical protein